MAAADFEQLLVVQGLDIQISQTEHRHRTHPLRAEIVAIDEQLAQSQIELDELATRQADAERSRKRLDDEVQTVAAKRADIGAKLYDGSVTSSKDLLAMQEEERHLAERQSSLEDDELEFMEQIETIGADMAAVEAARQPVLDKRSAAEKDLAQALSDIDAEIAALMSEREAAIAPLDDDVVATYDRRRKDLGGVAVARLEGSTCSGCHLTLSAVAVDQMKKLPPDAVVTCEDCGRILVR